MKALSVMLTIIVSVLTILQFIVKIDVYNLLILPIVSFFVIPIPLYSIPLTLLIVLIVLLVLAYTSGSNTAAISTAAMSNPLARADILDSQYVRYIALLCRTPQTADSLKQKYQEFFHPNFNPGVYSFEYCLKELEERELIIFQDGKWTVTQKALAYIAKYHG